MELAVTTLLPLDDEQWSSAAAWERIFCMVYDDDIPHSARQSGEYQCEALSGRHAIAATQGAIDFGSGGELLFLLGQQALLGIP